MRYLVVSDTHGRWEGARLAWERHGGGEALAGIFHLGDYAQDGEALARACGARVFSVAGNMDPAPQAPLYRILETELGLILLAHGHSLGVKSGLTRLLYKAEEAGCRAALFGHTHRPYSGQAGGIYLLNPGSLSRPGTGKPSYALLRLGENLFDATIVYQEKP